MMIKALNIYIMIILLQLYIHKLMKVVVVNGLWRQWATWIHSPRPVR